MAMMLNDPRFIERFGVDYAPNEVIFCEFEPGHDFYFINSGRVKIVKIINNREKTLDIMGPGDVFGEMAILEEEPRSASVIAMEAVKVLKFHRDNFDALLAGNPQLAYKLLIVFSKRIYDAKRRLMILLLADPSLKVMDVMCMLSEQDPHLDMSSPVHLKTNAQEISNWAGINMDDANKSLTHLANLGKIELFHDRVVVKNIRDFQRTVSTRRKQMFSK
ncbi:MAG: Crp/Fnr family transcriptional regulator [Spirochaetota bacterium]